MKSVFCEPANIAETWFFPKRIPLTRNAIVRVASREVPRLELKLMKLSNDYIRVRKQLLSYLQRERLSLHTRRKLHVMQNLAWQAPRPT